MGEPHEPDAGGQAAFDRAVDRERAAIDLHEQSALHLEQMAADLEKQAELDNDEHLRDDAHEIAGRAREHASRARNRAGKVRSRLHADGVDPWSGEHLRRCRFSYAASLPGGSLLVSIGNSSGRPRVGVSGRAGPDGCAVGFALHRPMR